MLNKTFKQTLIYNAKAVIGSKIISNTWLLIEDNKIKRIGKGIKPKLKNAKLINARGNFLSAGFIDLHIHGDIEKISTQQAKTGTTGFLKGLHAGDFGSFEDKIKDPFDPFFINPDGKDHIGHGRDKHQTDDQGRDHGEGFGECQRFEQLTFGGLHGKNRQEAHDGG